MKHALGYGEKLCMGCVMIFNCFVVGVLTKVSRVYKLTHGEIELRGIGCWIYE